MLLSANMIVCETVLNEKETDIISAIRIMNTVVLRHTNFARFSILTFLSSQPADFGRHVLKISLTNQVGAPIGHVNPYEFSYGYKADLSGPGAFMLRTDVNLDTAPFGLPTNCLIAAFLDSDPQPVATIPLMLRRG